YDQNILIWKYVISFIFVILYLFHNRLADDRRDFDFDNKFYPNRAVQKGLISLKQINHLSYIAILFMVIIAGIFSFLSLTIFTLLILYTLIAKKDFFLPIDFKEKHLFGYNFLNMLQILSLQIFIYVSIIDSLDFTHFIYSHILFVFILSIQVEISRKIKPEKSLANDLYSDRMGMGRSILLWGAFGIFSILNSAYLAYIISIQLNTILFLEFIMLLLFFIGGTLYYLKKSLTYENYFLATMILTYLGQNLFLAYA
ncbi:MAG: hypothetical protein VYA09_04350, partial [Candidatus Neomarinimicrobiota bacterium]|nr:hypothetical protein [Candidatus Neomarinimicrobiota bacterium]